MHYATLQKRLKKLLSDRDLLDYDGTKPGVLSVKLDFLRLLTFVIAENNWFMFMMLSWVILCYSSPAKLFLVMECSYPITMYGAMNRAQQASQMRSRSSLQECITLRNILFNLMYPKAPNSLSVC